MSVEAILQRMRRALLLIVIGICVGTFLELVLTEHTGEPAQFIPFVLSVLGALTAGAVWFRPQRRTIRRLRFVMYLTIAGSLFGLFEHFKHNLEFELEIDATLQFADAILPALMGANPALAPGILFLGGVLGILATWQHPALKAEQ